MFKKQICKFKGHKVKSIYYPDDKNCPRCGINFCNKYGCFPGFVSLEDWLLRKEKNCVRCDSKIIMDYGPMTFSSKPLVDAIERDIKNDQKDTV